MWVQVYRTSIAAPGFGVCHVCHSDLLARVECARARVLSIIFCRSHAGNNESSQSLQRCSNRHQLSELAAALCHPPGGLRFPSCGVFVTRPPEFPAYCWCIFICNVTIHPGFARWCTYLTATTTHNVECRWSAVSCPVFIRKLMFILFVPFQE